MITINTINHSWYFIKETIIKPNTSLTYDETLLNKSETKDLLESVSSKRISLSSEDLIKVQNRYNSFNSGGNVDLSEIISKIENIYKDDGVSGAILTNVEYNDGVFNYTSGTVNGYAGYTAVESISVVQSGTLTVSSVPTGVTYLAVISGNQVPNDFPAVVLTLGDGTLATTQTSYPVSYGDIIEIEWTTNSISALIDGQWVSSITEDTLNDPHLLVFSLLNTDPLYFSIPGFAAGGVRSGVLVEEIDERIAADLDITEALSHKASLGGDGKILEEQLPEMVKDVLVYPTYLDFPTVNQPSEKILIDSSLNKMYYWNGTTYIPLPASSDSVSEGVSNLYFTPARAQAAVINIQGNSATSSKLQAPVAIELTGGVVSNPVYFDGSSDISIEAYPILEDSGVYPGIYNNSATEITPLIIDSKGRVIGTDPPVIISPDWSSINSPPNTIYGYGITDAYTKDEVDTAISGVSGTGGAIPRPKFAGGTKRYLTGVWHDYTFGWVPSSTGYTTSTLGSSGDTWLYPFIPLDNCVVSDLGICTGLVGFAGNIKLGFYDSSSSAKPNNKLFGSSLISTAVANTVLSASTGGIAVTAGNLYWIALFSQSGGNPSLVFCNNSLFPMVTNGTVNTSTSSVYGYRLNVDGFGQQTDLPTFPDQDASLSYSIGTMVPRLLFKISS